jgi:hypothetical protein
MKHRKNSNYGKDALIVSPECEEAAIFLGINRV